MDTSSCTSARSKCIIKAVSTSKERSSEASGAENSDETLEKVLLLMSMVLLVCLKFMGGGYEILGISIAVFAAFNY